MFWALLEWAVALYPAALVLVLIAVGALLWRRQRLEAKAPPDRASDPK